jgi:hypothetical protein
VTRSACNDNLTCYLSRDWYLPHKIVSISQSTKRTVKRLFRAQKMHTSQPAPRTTSTQHVLPLRPSPLYLILIPPPNPIPPAQPPSILENPPYFIQHFPLLLPQPVHPLQRRLPPIPHEIIPLLKQPALCFLDAPIQICDDGVVLRLHVVGGGEAQRVGAGATGVGKGRGWGIGSVEGERAGAGGAVGAGECWEGHFRVGGCWRLLEWWLCGLWV